MAAASEFIEGVDLVKVFDDEPTEFDGSSYLDVLLSNIGDDFGSTAMSEVEPATEEFDTKKPQLSSIAPLLTMTEQQRNHQPTITLAPSQEQPLQHYDHQPMQPPPLLSIQSCASASGAQQPHFSVAFASTSSTPKTPVDINFRQSSIQHRVDNPNKRSFANIPQQQQTPRTNSKPRLNRIASAPTMSKASTNQIYIPNATMQNASTLAMKPPPRRSSLVGPLQPPLPLPTGLITRGSRAPAPISNELWGSDHGKSKTRLSSEPNLIQMLRSPRHFGSAHVVMPPPTSASMASYPPFHLSTMVQNGNHAMHSGGHNGSSL